MVLSHAPTLISTFSWIFTSTNISKIALFWQWNKFYFNLLIFHCDIFYITFNFYSLLAELFTKFLFLISEYFYDEEHKGKKHISLMRNYEALRFCFGGGCLFSAFCKVIHLTTCMWNSILSFMSYLAIFQSITIWWVAFTLYCSHILY